MNTTKSKVTIPSPKLHDFTAHGDRAKSNLYSGVIWEVGVPGKNSLPWSIALSYLYLSSDSDFNEFLKKVTGDDKEVEEIKKKKNLGSGPLNAQVINQQLESFNPFKNRQDFFDPAKEVTEVCRIFDTRLNRYGSSLRRKNDEWNDDFKLNAASLLLECEIEVYFPDETATPTIVSYPKSLHKFNSKIVLFQYKDQQRGSRVGNINIFRFGMPAQLANPRKLDAHIQDDYASNCGSLFDLSARRVTIASPKLHDFTAHGESTKSNFYSGVIWEVGVPGKNSLPWSIVLSYLYLSSDLDFNEFLKKITGDDKEVEEIKEIKNLGSAPLNTHIIKRQLESFNPFKNRHAFFAQAKEVKEVFRIFDFRLNRYGNSLRKNGEWNDDFKLSAASLLLECEIEVHFPDETATPTIVLYPKSLQKFKTKIVLFQYNDQQHGLRVENINIFRFGMPAQLANPRKLDALGHFLRKADISSESILKVKNLMKNCKDNGQLFLTTILKSECSDILQEIYKSPYIAVKIKEAGFETDPLASSDGEKLSAFSQSVLSRKDSKYLYILYDYASNCRSLFDLSTRRANDDVLETLKKIKSLLEEDISELSTGEKWKDCNSVQRSLNTLNQCIAYTEYQIKVASDLNNLKKNFELNFESSTGTKADTFNFRKSVIKSILSHYQNFFHYNLDSQLFSSMSISDQFSNYLHFSEYYRNLDNFACITFFDNFYQLRLLIDLTQENVFLNIEWKMFAAILFNNYFPEFVCETEDNLTFDQKKFEKVNVIRYVPLLHRNVLQSDIPSFLQKLEKATDSEMLQKSLNINSAKRDSSPLPMVVDVLLKIRLEMHIQAALKVSPVDGNIKSILAIERALQVIGESIKPPSSNNCIISFFLRSCLSASLQKSLVIIRNDLSHQRYNSAYGRLTIEKDFKFFRKIQEEISHIKQQFEIAFFTQFLRIEETSMYNCLNEIGHELQQDVRKVFMNEYIQRIDERLKIYEKNHGKCVELLFDTLCDLQNHIGKAKKEPLMGQLRAINYLLDFISRHTPSVTVLNNFKAAVNLRIPALENEEMELFENGLRSFLEKWIDILQQNNITGQRPLSAPAIESFFCLLKSDLFSTDEECQLETALQDAYKEANDTLKDLLKLNSNETEKLEIFLKKVFIPIDQIASIKNYFNSKNRDKALNLLKQKRFSEDTFKTDIKDFFQPKSGTSDYFKILLTKVTYQKYLSSPIYTNVKLSDHILEKLEFHLTKIVHILIERIKALKSILIDEDDEIQETWIWGKSKEIKHHMKFLMRQRYMRDITVRAALDIAFFDCINILHKPILSDLYEKSTDLFSGIDLRNVLSHRTNIPETIGGILDEDDFPSTMIEKMLELIDDLEAIESTLELFPKIGILEKADFVKWTENSSEKEYMKQVKAIRECERWDSYSFLFPFIKKN